MKSVYIIIRYSIISKVNKAWIISRTDYETYKKEIFSEARMKRREELFKAFTLPSLKNLVKYCPKDVDLKIMIITSVELPDQNKKNLYQLTESIRNIEVHEIDEQENYVKYMERKAHADLAKKRSAQGVCATVRLDDDDALADDFMLQLDQYLDPKFSEYCISFTKGYRAYHLEDGTIRYEVSYTPMIAQGLSYVKAYDLSLDRSIKTIYSVGDHKKVDRKRPVILDSRAIGYIWSVHADSDMSQNDKNRINAGKNFSTVADVQAEFSWIDAR